MVKLMVERLKDGPPSFLKVADPPFTRSDFLTKLNMFEYFGLTEMKVGLCCNIIKFLLLADTQKPLQVQLDKMSTHSMCK